MGRSSTRKAPLLYKLNESFLTPPSPPLKSEKRPSPGLKLLRRYDYLRPAQQLSVAEVAQAKHPEDEAWWNRALIDLTVSVMKQLVERLSLWMKGHDAYSLQPQKECMVDSIERLLRDSADPPSALST